MPKVSKEIQDYLNDKNDKRTVQKFMEDQAIKFISLDKAKKEALKQLSKKPKKVKKGASQRDNP